MGRLQGKVAIITGASSGIGKATAKLFATEGAKLVIGARRVQHLETLAAEIRENGGAVEPLAGDVNSEEFHQQLVNLAVSEFGHLDIAFNNAGILPEPQSVTSLSLETWQSVIGTNLTSGFLAAKHQVPALAQRKGSLIYTSSFVGYTLSFPQQAAYSASKAGLIGLVKSLASEYGPVGLRVNALLPGGTNTAMAKDFGESPEVRKFVEGIHALKRIAAPEEIANSALFLASELSSFVTGSAMLVDGGVSVSRA